MQPLDHGSEAYWVVIVRKTLRAGSGVNVLKRIAPRQARNGTREQCRF
jgi:hypothetical protein